MDFTRSLTQELSKQLIDPIVNPVRDWLTQHPLWNWLLLHPLWLLGLVVLVLFLFAGLMGAIAHLTETIWLTVLRLPIRLTQWIFWGVVQLFKLPFTPRLNGKKTDPVQSQERLTEILDRLEALRQEQDQLMAEVRSIMTVQKPIYESNQSKKVELKQN